MNYVEFPLNICIIWQTFTLNQSIFFIKKKASHGGQTTSATNSLFISGKLNRYIC